MSPTKKVKFEAKQDPELAILLARLEGLTKDEQVKIRAVKDDFRVLRQSLTAEASKRKRRLRQENWRMFLESSYTQLLEDWNSRGSKVRLYPWSKYSFCAEHEVDLPIIGLARARIEMVTESFMCGKGDVTIWLGFRTTQNGLKERFLPLEVIKEPSADEVASYLQKAILKVQKGILPSLATAKPIMINLENYTLG